LGRFLYVGGNSEIKLKSSDPASVAYSKHRQYSLSNQCLSQGALTAASKVIANVLLLFFASVFGESSNLCSVHLSATLFDFTSTLLKTSFSPRADCNDAVNEPLYEPLT